MNLSIRNVLNLTLICISFIVQQITLIYLSAECDMSKPHRHKSNASLLLICVKSSGQCSNTTRVLGYASTELHSSNIAVAHIKFAPHKHIVNVNEFFEFLRILKMSKMREFSRILNLWVTNSRCMRVRDGRGGKMSGSSNSSRQNLNTALGWPKTSLR